MTVTYTSEVATCNKFGTFWKLLFRWKGGIYKLVWPELMVYTMLYYICSMVYRFVLDDQQKRTFERVSLYCQYFTDLIPVSFVLGFYVSIVVTRWWAQYESLPWPDSLALFISTSIHGQDHRSRLMRRTVMRYVNLAELLTLIMISPTVKKRFPTLDHVVESGFMTENEQKIFDDLDTKTSHPKYWMPLVWAGSIVARARKEGRIRDDFAVKTIIDEINRFRGLCGGLLSYDWISIPLVYTQVVSLSVYTFFLGTIMGRQFLDPKQGIANQDIDFYVPIFTFLQFFFYMGWLKVAESLVNPFGEDDDDFEVNWLVDRNLQVSYLIVDEMHSEHPELIQDKYWDEIFPTELPYTIASEHFRIDPPQGSTANIEVPEVEQEFLPLLEEEDEDEDEGIHRTSSYEGQDLENGETKAIDIRVPVSARSSISGVASSHHSAARKPSMLSMIVQRMKYGSSDTLRRRSMKPHGSTPSMRQTKRPRGFNRSASRISSTSQVTSQSRDSVQRNPTILTQGSAIFRMSDLSINTSGQDDAHSPRMKSGLFSTHDEDEPIHIKIKRRDKDGRVIKSPSSDEFDHESECSRTHLLPKIKKPGPNLFSYECMTDDTSEENVRTREVAPDNKSIGSSCSIRTSIFQGEEDEDNDLGDDEGVAAQVQIKRRRGGMKGLKGAFSKIRSRVPQYPLDPNKKTPYTLSKWLNSDSPKITVDPTSEDEDHPIYDEHRSSMVSASLPVSPAHRSPKEGGRRITKSLATLESPLNETSGLLEDSISPIAKTVEEGTGSSSQGTHTLSTIVVSPNAEQGLVTSTPLEMDDKEFDFPQQPSDIVYPEQSDTKIDILPKEVEDAGAHRKIDSSEDSGKNNIDITSDSKLEPLTEEPILEALDSKGNELWV